MILTRNSSGLDALHPLGHAPNTPTAVSGSAGIMRRFWSLPLPPVVEVRLSAVCERVGCNSEVDTLRCSFDTLKIRAQCNS